MGVVDTEGRGGLVGGSEPRTSVHGPDVSLVLGSGYRKGVTDVVIGTTTQRILDSVGCSVFAVKPKGFVSPVVLNDRARERLSKAAAE